MPLEWKASKPTLDPFGAVAGDLTEYQIHFAKSAAVDPAAIEAAIGDITLKAFGFCEANAGERTKRLLFLWDVVYSILTVVYTDDSMMYDARHVTKCSFSELDKEGRGGELSCDIRRWIKASVAGSRHGRLPETMPVFYSDQDRASYGADFEAEQLTND